MSRFVHVTRGGDETGGDEPTPERQSPEHQSPEHQSRERQLLERQSAVRDHVMRRLQEPTQGRRDSRFPAIGLGDEGQGARRCHLYFTPIHPQPFYRAELGFREGDFPVTELAGRTSIAIPFHNHLTADEIDYVACVLERALGEVR